MSKITNGEARKEKKKLLYVRKFFGVVLLKVADSVGTLFVFILCLSIGVLLS